MVGMIICSPEYENFITLAWGKAILEVPLIEYDLLGGIGGGLS